jgi:hypothetical protein
MFFAGRLVTRRVSLALLRSRASRIARFSLSAVHAENVEQQQSTQATRQKFEFQAETKSLLDIVAKSLYSEQEVRGSRGSRGLTLPSISRSSSAN